MTDSFKELETNLKAKAQLKNILRVCAYIGYFMC